MSGIRKVAFCTGSVVLLLAVAFASGARRSPTESGGGQWAPTQIASYIAVLVVLLLAVAAALAAWLMLQSRHAGVPDEPPDWHSTLVAFAVLTLLAIGGLGAVKRMPEAHSSRVVHTTASTQSRNYGTFLGTRPMRSARPRHRWHVPLLPTALGLGSVLLIGAGLSLLAVNRHRHETRHGHETPPNDGRAILADAFHEITSDSLDDLRHEPDPRRVVIRAYARMEEAFASCGYPRRESDAPREYLARTLPSVSVEPSLARRLTALFERARFSEHRVGPQLKDDAIETLTDLLVDLEKPSVPGST